MKFPGRCWFSSSARTSPCCARKKQQAHDESKSSPRKVSRLLKAQERETRHTPLASKGSYAHLSGHASTQRAM
eukprot:6183934-Pleurochrysis_carterae.AAC.3